MRYSKLLALANHLQATVPIIAFAVVIFISSWPSFAHPELPVLALNLYLAIALVMFAMILSVWVLSDRSSRQEERIQKLEDEIDQLRKWIQD